MNRAFRNAYDRELALLKERAREFALEYPGLADRLGGLLEENLDPTAAGLLEGSAFLAARVQLKMQEEFRTFTSELLEQLLPDALAPTPSVMLLRARVAVENPDIVRGQHFAAGSYMDARFRDADKRVSCRFALAAPLTIWPLQIGSLSYHQSAGPIGALGQEIARGTKGGLVFSLQRLGPAGRGEALPLAELELDHLVVHLTGSLGDAVMLYEQLFCDVTRISLRWLNAQGDPVFARLPPHAIEQIGFTEEERLFPHRRRQFSGFATLREAFVFPRKFLGFRLTGLRQVLKKIPAGEVQVIVEFDSVAKRLAARIDATHLTLNAAPAVNLFEELSSQVQLDGKRHEYLVTPNSSPSSHYELQAVEEVWAFYPGHRDKVRVYPLYALPPDGQNPRQVLYYTVRRKPRRLTNQERRFGSSRYRYRGTETYLALYEPPGESRAERLQVRAICSNRHLPEYLPIAQGVDDFHFCDDQTVTLSCIAGPTPPRVSLADLETGELHRTDAGDVYWRLISYLSLNQFGLRSPDGEDSAAALREMLSLFADLSEGTIAAQIAGLRKVESRPVTRTLAMADGYHTARGLEVALTFDEDEFEGSGVILLGAVLDRFLAEYAAINSFTQTVVKTVQRGVIKTWPPRSGNGAIL